MTTTPSPARPHSALTDLLAHRTLAVAAVLVGAVAGVLTALAATTV
ncbi:hypothetical protein [Cellulomonas palmilytica]|nr:hypothetical protein [Cellulomonas palmilytica]UJP40368.1 hypothetical protein F1D97_02200 [Cellulomonas palmilytica]